MTTRPDAFLPVLAHHSMAGARRARDGMRTSVGRLAEHLDAPRDAGYRAAGLTDAFAATTSVTSARTVYTTTLRVPWRLTRRVLSMDVTG